MGKGGPQPGQQERGGSYEEVFATRAAHTNSSKVGWVEPSCLWLFYLVDRLDVVLVVCCCLLHSVLHPTVGGS